MSTRAAVMGDAIKISRMLEAAMRAGFEGAFPINRKRLLDHVMETIKSPDGFAEVLVDDDGALIGCFCGELGPHAYINANVVSELGSYIMPEYRGKHLFEKLFLSFLKWSDLRPDRLFTTFSIGQINETTPALRRILKQNGFQQVTEGYFRK